MPTCVTILLSVVLTAALMEHVTAVFYTNSRENDFPRLGRRSSNRQEFFGIPQGGYEKRTRPMTAHEALAKLEGNGEEFSKDEESAFGQAGGVGSLIADRSFKRWNDNGEFLYTFI